MFAIESTEQRVTSKRHRCDHAIGDADSGCQAMRRQQLVSTRELGAIRQFWQDDHHAASSRFRSAVFKWALTIGVFGRRRNRRATAFASARSQVSTLQTKITMPLTRGNRLSLVRYPRRHRHQPAVTIPTRSRPPTSPTSGYPCQSAPNPSRVGSGFTSRLPALLLPGLNNLQGRRRRVSGSLPHRQ